MRQLHKVNFGDQVIIKGNDPNARTACRISIDDLPEDLRDLFAMQGMQWTVTARCPQGIVYPAVDTPPAYVTLTIVQGHGGTSTHRDVDATAFCRTTGAGSYVEVRARFVDANGQSLAGKGSAGLTATVDVSICPGTDNEAEPQLWWTPIRKLTLDLAAQLPNGSAFVPNLRMGQQKLRRARVRQTNDGSATYFFQTFDQDVGNPPVAGAVPKTSDPIAVSPAQLDIDWGHQGLSYSRGLWFAISTTDDTLTFGAANSWHYQAQLYRLDSGDGT